jgi:limonene-1,2-epoxide hydrolase
MLLKSSSIQASTDQEALALEFFDGMGPDLTGFANTFRRMMAESAVWETVGKPPRLGREACLAYLDVLNQGAGMQYCEIVLHNIASNGELVFTERNDRMMRADGSLIFDVPIVGVVELKDAKIIRYTDYCDLSGIGW